MAGAAEGEALVTHEALSFWGGYDFTTGTIIDKHHPLAGVRAAGRVLVVPFSKGSSTTTAVLLEAVRAGTAPAALLTTGADPFFALASIVADVMYGQPFPVIALSGRLRARFGPESGRASTPIDNYDYLALRSVYRNRQIIRSPVIPFDTILSWRSPRTREADRLASRFGAFVAERYPFALADAIEAFERPPAGREPRDERDRGAAAGIQRELANGWIARAMPQDCPTRRRGTPRAARSTGPAELLDACDGFLRRAAIERR